MQFEICLVIIRKQIVWVRWEGFLVGIDFFLKVNVCLIYLSQYVVVRSMENYLILKGQKVGIRELDGIFSNFLSFKLESIMISLRC